MVSNLPCSLSFLQNQKRTFYLLNSKCGCLIGVEPWTFEQRLGEAVFIPAGCPHQVRNLKVKNHTYIFHENPDDQVHPVTNFFHLSSHVQKLRLILFLLKTFENASISQMSSGNCRKATRPEKTNQRYHIKMRHFNLAISLASISY